MKYIYETISHDQRHQITPFIRSYFEKITDRCLDTSFSLACDLSHFKQIKNRLVAGENLSNQIPQLKKLSSDQALIVIKKLIKESETKLITQWNLHKLTKTKTKVAFQFFKGELVPRFCIGYEVPTKLGVLTLNVRTQGRYIFVSNETKDIKISNMELALFEAEKQLTMGGLAM